MRNCKNCGHREGEVCMLSGFDWDIERQSPTVCGINFEGWVQKEPSVLDRVLREVKLWF